MQRYNELYDPYTGALELDDNGAYVLYSEAQAEIDRLRALLETPKVLKGHELTKEGFYWHRVSRFCGWEIHKIYPQLANKDYYAGRLTGQFIGPLKKPEV